MNDEIRHRRITYDRSTLDVADAAPDPFVQFGVWFEDAEQSPEVMEANAMTVASCDQRGRPSARIVLLRGWDRCGFVFYTNYESRKGRELDASHDAALLFFWAPLQRQVRIEGRAERVTAAESDAYFASRPRGHRLSAWASQQSAVVLGRAALEQAMDDAAKRFPDDVPRPPHWGGFRIVPERFEFWQGRPNRVHDRIVYLRAGDDWTRERLAP